MLTKTLIENMYVVQNGDHTVDTVIGVDVRLGAAIAGSVASSKGGVTDVAQISILEQHNLELDGSELTFDFVISNN